MKAGWNRSCQMLWQSSPPCKHVLNTVIKKSHRYTSPICQVLLHIEHFAFPTNLKPYWHTWRREINDLHLRHKIHLCSQIYSTWIFEGGKYVFYQLHADNIVHQNCRQTKGKLSVIFAWSIVIKNITFCIKSQLVYTDILSKNCIILSPHRKILILVTIYKGKIRVLLMRCSEFQNRLAISRSIHGFLVIWVFS